MGSEKKRRETEGRPSTGREREKERGTTSARALRHTRRTGGRARVPFPTDRSVSSRRTCDATISDLRSPRRIVETATEHTARCEHRAVGRTAALTGFPTFRERAQGRTIIRSGGRDDVEGYRRAQFSRASSDFSAFTRVCPTNPRPKIYAHFSNTRLSFII